MLVDCVVACVRVGRVAVRQTASDAGGAGVARVEVDCVVASDEGRVAAG